jgi:hypothetical protein
MKKILLTLMALASVVNAQLVDDKTFFSGAYIGETIDECMAYYYPNGIPAGLIYGPIDGVGDRAAAASPGAIANAGSAFLSGAPYGEQEIDFRTTYIDFRTNFDPHGDRRVVVFYRESDRKVVSVRYWKMSGDQTFDMDMIDYLVHLNRGRGLGIIVSELYDNRSQFIVQTEERRRKESKMAPFEPDKLHTE